jgi:predicted TIM-barrel fold metal-dependent hydrolase
MIIDAHAHIFDRMRGRIASGPIKPLTYGKVRLGDGQVIRILPPIAPEIRFAPQVLLEHMTDAGVDKAVLLQGPFYDECNAYVHQAMREFPDRFAGAAYVDLWGDSALEDFRTAIDRFGFRIVKLELSEATGLAGLHPDLRLDESRIDWFWAECERQRIVVTLDLGAVRARSYQTRPLSCVLDAHPELRVVIAHLAQPPISNVQDPELESMWIEQLMLGKRANVWFDLASLPAYAAGEDYPYPTARKYLKQAVEMIGAEKLMWGSDAPAVMGHGLYVQLLDYVRRHCDFLKEQPRADVLGGNAAHVYFDPWRPVAGQNWRNHETSR